MSKNFVESALHAVIVFHVFHLVSLHGSSLGSGHSAALTLKTGKDFWIRLVKTVFNTHGRQENSSILLDSCSDKHQNLGTFVLTRARLPPTREVILSQSQ